MAVHSGKEAGRNGKNDESRVRRMRDLADFVIKNGHTLAAQGRAPRAGRRPLRFIDLFCGIGGFRIAFERAGAKCVF